MPTTRAVFPCFVVLALAASCGHSSATLDAYNNAKKTGVTGTAATGNTGGGDTGGGSSGGSGNSGNQQQFSCTTVASQQFDKDYMKAYSEPAGTSQWVEDTLNVMDAAGRAKQMMGIPVGGKDYFDIERSPDAEVTGAGYTIRGYNYRDAGRGVNLDAGQPNNRQSDGKDYATVFPAASIRAASWETKSAWKPASLPPRISSTRSPPTALIARRCLSPKLWRSCPRWSGPRSTRTVLQRSVGRSGASTKRWRPKGERSTCRRRSVRDSDPANQKGGRLPCRQ
jgi:hypothetical protein